MTCVDPDVLSSCVLAFPPEAEQSWWPTARLTNVAGEVCARPISRFPAPARV